jgi:hypothetical protein
VESHPSQRTRRMGHPAQNLAESVTEGSLYDIFTGTLKNTGGWPGWLKGAGASLKEGTAAESAVLWAYMKYMAQSGYYMIAGCQPN